MSALPARWHWSGKTNVHAWCLASTSHRMLVHRQECILAAHFWQSGVTMQVPGASRRCHLDGSICHPVVCSAREPELQIHFVQRHNVGPLDIYLIGNHVWQPADHIWQPADRSCALADPVTRQATYNYIPRSNGSHHNQFTSTARIKTLMGYQATDINPLADASHHVSSSTLDSQLCHVHNHNLVDWSPLNAIWHWPVVLHLEALLAANNTHDLRPSNTTCCVRHIRGL